jgi:hypothetical protein
MENRFYIPESLSCSVGAAEREHAAALRCEQELLVTT